jgi:hypothetical protein
MRWESLADFLLAWSLEKGAGTFCRTGPKAVRANGA